MGRCAGDKDSSALRERKEGNVQIIGFRGKWLRTPGRHVSLWSSSEGMKTTIVFNETEKEEEKVGSHIVGHMKEEKSVKGGTGLQKSQCPISADDYPKIQH